MAPLWRFSAILAPDIDVVTCSSISLDGSQALLDRVNSNILPVFMSIERSQDCVANSFAAMQVLLVFPKTNDPQCTALADAVYRMNLSCYYATSDEDARIAYTARFHSIVIIDTRNSKLLDGLSLCRCLELFSPTASGFSSILSAHFQWRFHTSVICPHICGGSTTR